MRILVAEDDVNLLHAVTTALKNEAYEVDAAENGEECLFYAEQDIYDILVLDIVMPGISGLEVVKRVRAAGKQVPILLLTARDSIPDRVAGLNAGADDYLVKPFALQELFARIMALLRRSANNPLPHRITCGSLELDEMARRAEYGGVDIGLTQKEYEILEFLVINQGRILTRSQICNRIWGYDSDISFGILDVHMHNLRKKIAEQGRAQLIQTIRGVGYICKAP